MPSTTAASSALDSADDRHHLLPVRGPVPPRPRPQNNINDGSTALDQAWAQLSLNQAKTQLSSVDGLINEFTVNDSLKTTDSRLAVIINKHDLAAQAISNANDLFTNGNYPSARGKANEGLNLANQAWNLSLDLKTELGKGFSLPGLPNLSAFLPVIIVVLIVRIAGHLPSWSLG